MAEQILALGRESHSVEVAHEIKKDDDGGDLALPLPSDVRPPNHLGVRPKGVPRDRVYDGGSLAFMMQHTYETELHGVDPLVLDRKSVV